MTYDELLEELHANADLKYNEFNAKIIRTGYNTIGVRTPAVIGLGRTVDKEFPGYIDAFCGHTDFSYEELFIAVLVCGNIKEYDRGKAAFERLLPRFDNWSIVDQGVCRQKWLKPDIIRAIEDFEYLKSDVSYFNGEFYKRTYVMTLFDYCLNDKHLDFAIEKLLSVPTGDYYVDMAIAWMLCDIAIKYYDRAVSLIKNKCFSPFVLKKAVSKCRDSFRLTVGQKDYLKSLL